MLIAKIFLLKAHLMVTEAKNGKVAVECVRRQLLNLILMDVQMPVMGGFEATRYRQEQLGITTSIITLTASAVSGEQERYLTAGVNDYLAKPFYEDELVQGWVLRSPACP